MGVEKLVCPHCEKKEVKLDFAEDGELKKFKGASWAPTLIKAEGGRWTQDLNSGAAINCKCGRHYFVHSIDRNPSSFQASKAIPSGQHIPVFCENCAAAFFDSEMKCPKCGKQH